MEEFQVLSDPKDCGALCPRCGGSGEETVLVGGGPDAYEQTVNCQHCDGHGTLYHAYKGLERSLKDMHKAHLEACAKLYIAPTADRIAALEAERDALRKDVERYRWLRDQWGYLCVGEGVIELEGKFNPMDGFLDEAIDAAIDAKEPK